LDPTRYFNAKIKKGEEFNLKFTSDKNGDVPFEVEFGKNDKV